MPVHEHVTILRPDAPLGDARGISSALPADVLEQVRGRVRLLAGLLLAAFAFDPLFFAGNWTWSALSGHALTPEFYEAAPFQWVNLGAVVISGVLWWAARSRLVSPSRLHTLGLIYEVAICFVLAIVANWQHYRNAGSLPNLTWVPTIVVLFPLIMPGPPARMLWTTILASATSPLSILILERLGKVTANVDDYARAIVGSVFAAGFAHMGARIVYGLGREVVAAREMGSYHLEERLGQGGMGEVWRARHRLLARPAAIKLIRPSLVGHAQAGISDDARRRFEREAQAIARLRSPHTVHLFDFGVAADGAFYYVMELLDGLDADKLVRQTGPVPAERVIHVLRQVCHSLSEAESYGLVHRDIKPANIFLCRYGEDPDFVKVLDFGLVKAVAEEANTESALTRDNVVAGTPAFMAPEQALGKSDLDGRADLYAVGCVAYWLLTGHAVFTGDTPMAVLVQHAQATPVRPSARTELPIPPALEQIVMSCLAKAPVDRPQTARELARRLAALDGAADWTEERANDWWSRHAGR